MARRARRSPGSALTPSPAPTADQNLPPCPRSASTAASHRQRRPARPRRDDAPPYGRPGRRRRQPSGRQARSPAATARRRPPPTPQSASECLHSCNAPSGMIHASSLPSTASPITMASGTSRGSWPPGGGRRRRGCGCSSARAGCRADLGEGGLPLEHADLEALAGERVRRGKAADAAADDDDDVRGLVMGVAFRARDRALERRAGCGDGRRARRSPRGGARRRSRTADR